MIVECEKCDSRFTIDESFLKEGGSKVRCSICKHLFTVYPPKEAPTEEPTPEEVSDERGAPEEVLDEELDETVSLDTPPAPGKKDAKIIREEAGADIDDIFENEVEEIESIEEISTDGFPEAEDEEPVDIEEIIKGAERIEEEVEGEDTEKRVPKKKGEPMRVEPAPLSREKPGRSLLFPAILGFIVLLLGGAAAVLFFAPDLIHDSLSFLGFKKQDITDIGVRRLSFTAVTGSFVQSNKEGQLFVIKGMINNNYSHNRRFILVKAAILDDKGQVVKSKKVYAGNTFTKKELKDMTLEEINEGLKNRYGKGRMNFNIRPDSAIPFMIVFGKLPKNMSEFTVEAVSSTKGE